MTARWALEQVAASLHAAAIPTDVADPMAMQELAAAAPDADLVCLNAGIVGTALDAPYPREWSPTRGAHTARPNQHRQTRRFSACHRGGTTSSQARRAGGERAPPGLDGGAFERSRVRSKARPPCHELVPRVQLEGSRRKHAQWPTPTAPTHAKLRPRRAVNSEHYRSTDVEVAVVPQVMARGVRWTTCARGGAKDGKGQPQSADGPPPGLPARGRRKFFWVEVVPLREAVIILLGGEIDMRTVDQFTEAVDTAFTIDTPTVILDISRIDFFGAAGMPVLATAQRRAAVSGRTLRVVVDEQRLLLRLLRIAGMTGSIALFQDLDAAVNAAADTTGETIDFGRTSPS
jgi:anti-anti-sigma factor